jgi:thymidylate synthase (FAD)
MKDKMGSDLTVVNAARVSFANMHRKFESDKDEKLISYLAKHGHWSPFAHCSMQFHIIAPIFVARQLVKHQVGLAWNEVSRRYVDTEVEFYNPKEWRARPDKSIKQGSAEEVVDINPRGDLVDHYQRAIKSAKWSYEQLLRQGVAPEMARMVLPQSTMTEWYWTGSLYAFARVCKLRLEKTAQKETQMIVNDIAKQAQQAFPISWKYLTENN